MSPAEVLRSYRGKWLPVDRWLHLAEKAYVQGTLFELPGFTRRPTRAEIEETNVWEMGRCPECDQRPIQGPILGVCHACAKRKQRQRKTELQREYRARAKSA